MNKEDIKNKLINKFSERATYDKELGVWSIELDEACDIVEIILGEGKQK